MVLGTFLIGLATSWEVFFAFFGKLDFSKMSVSLKRGAIFEKIMFSSLDSVWDGFLMDVGWFWEPFGAPFWNQSRIQNQSKKRSEFGWLLEGI